ncbi:MAG: hypothetical protein QN141_13045 [Armatimonadota bacterium]|nr:hypothetical protein [Armatimonadota bacterium]MDR7500304.1 hypothetical protein [Armatimonadota bacterium]MDR7559403.1 hypothetical protein [Armatimonadota bacterium]MDR7573671.1 hypothetical protein [Armatimonadota bacterium]
MRRDFGAQDAWVVRTSAGCRLDVRVDGRVVALLEDAEDAFWARFYAPVERERLHLGERRIEIEQWRLAPADLAAVLRPCWEAQVGSRGGGAGPRSG